MKNFKDSNTIGPIADKAPCGDRSDERRRNAVELVQQQRGAILRRIHRLLGDGARKVTDTEEILSTALRRIDQAIVMGNIEAVSDAQFYAFMHAVIERSILEKARASRRLVNRELAAARLQSGRSAPNPQDRGMTIEKLAWLGKQVRDPVDREIILLRVRGLGFTEVARSMGMTPEAARKRWSRAREAVRALMHEDSYNDDY